MRRLLKILGPLLLVINAMGAIAVEGFGGFAQAAFPVELAPSIPAEIDSEAGLAERPLANDALEPQQAESRTAENGRPAPEESDQLPPVEGSQLGLEQNQCATCHRKSDLRDGEHPRLYVPLEGLAEDVHWRHGVNCHDCHGGDPESSDVSAAHSPEVLEGAGILPFRSSLGDVRKVCGDCHKEQRLQLYKGLHTHAGEKREDGTGMVLGCEKCHGEKAHGMLPVKDARSPVFLDHQVLTCGGCHKEDLETYKTTVHGQGLYQSGLLVTAVCADCHGSHGIYYAADKRSTLHVANVAGTCGKCHHFLEERINRGVHGWKDGSDETADGETKAEKLKKNENGMPERVPSCTDCHQGHDLLDPELAPFRVQLASRCGNCHADYSSRYAMSLHGELTQLGYGPAANCSDCHGSHEILPIDDPASPLRAGKNRLNTCRKCHIHAVLNFSQFDPHANHKDAENYPFLYFVDHWLKVLFYSFFTFFVIHSLLWFIRSFVHTFQYGRHKTLTTGQFALVRSEPNQRVLNAILFVSFLGLILTGLPLKYSSQPWAQSFARAMGGYATTSVWHHFFAAMALGGCAAHLVRGIKKIVDLRKQNINWRTILFGPDSPVPTSRDARDLFNMGRWFLGLGPKPRFERWTYWEKFDYWAVYLTAAVIGASGLLLWYPNLFCRVLPGQVLNVAKMVHEEIAILAASFLFLFHFFNNHFRPEKFPIDLSALTGLVSEEHLRRHRPEYVERLAREGKLAALRRPAPSQRRLWFVFLAGSVAFLLGLSLLALVLVVTLGK